MVILGFYGNHTMVTNDVIQLTAQQTNLWSRERFLPLGTYGVSGALQNPGLGDILFLVILSNTSPFADNQPGAGSSGAVASA